MIISSKNKKAQKGTGGERYLGHVDRYNRDAQYRGRCEDQVPPMPKWPIFRSGMVLRADGKIGDQRKVDRLGQ
jgi:hypothetical protein